ncbi:cyclic nucleotide-binding domain-containing protein [Paenibacillus filicis]|uniref:Cyclic nucleotide-binding domain-containing protein n=1 Tax=Paenibacillus filicis TaxID=669464 RepID=A0ABU9DLK2_9BACL
MSKDVLSIGQIGQTVSVRQGEVIFREGDPARHMYVVREGIVEIWLELEEKRIPAARLGPGDFFGEMSLLEALPRSGTAIAAEACTLFLLEEEAFHQQMALSTRQMTELADRLTKIADSLKA